MPAPDDPPITVLPGHNPKWGSFCQKHPRWEVHCPFSCPACSCWSSPPPLLPSSPLYKTDSRDSTSISWSATSGSKWDPRWMRWAKISMWSSVANIYWQFSGYLGHLRQGQAWRQECGGWHQRSGRGFPILKCVLLTVISQVRPAVESVVEDIKSGGKPADVIRWRVTLCI